MTGYTTRLRSPGADGGGSTAAGSQGATNTDTSGADATGSQGANQTQTQGGTSAGSGGGDQANSTTQAGSRFATVAEAEAELARLERDNAKLRRENAGTRVAAKAGETPEQKLQREIDDVRKEAEASKAELARERLTSRLKDQATAAYCLYPDVFARYYADQVKYNDQDEPTNITDLIAHARKHYPALFKVPSADAGATGGSVAQSRVDMNALMRAQAGRGGTGD